MNPFAVAGYDILDPLESSARFIVDTYNVLYSPSPVIRLVPGEKEKKSDLLPKFLLVMNMCETNYDLMEISILWSLAIMNMSSVWLYYLLCPLQLISTEIIAVPKKSAWNYSRHHLYLNLLLSNV